ncbi:hypothetical protein [Comamonas sp. GB3 AK4-5]|uniref:hypothetical protein n=1 Tax=Comamonas sp. GB3 AK4-5 TaxID=3231487 RepID=UPI00351F087C
MSETKTSTLLHIMEKKLWDLKREQERITYPPGHAAPVQMDWRQRESYSATDLDYRGRGKAP